MGPQIDNPMYEQWRGGTCSAMRSTGVDGGTQAEGWVLAVEEGGLETNNNTSMATATQPSRSSATGRTGRVKQTTVPEETAVGRIQRGMKSEKPFSSLSVIRRNTSSFLYI